MLEQKPAIQKASTANLQELLVDAQPRLLRYAQKYSLSQDNVDDIVQETMVEAWGHLQQLHSPERFDSWLTGICHNVCMRWNRAYRIQNQGFVRPDYFALEASNIEESEREIADPCIFDPSEDLIRQDLAVLLDHAMSRLSPVAREGLQLYYVEERAQDEIAEQLGMTEGTLKVRLHRARRQLWRVLNNEMRLDAKSFGLILEDEQEVGWRKTSIWCLLCGQYRADGCLDTMPGGESILRLRCPGCELHGIKLVQSGGVVPLDGLRSFRPMYKRVMQAIPDFFKSAVEEGYGPCLLRGGKMRYDGMRLRSDISHSISPLFNIRLECQRCGPIETSLVSLHIDYKAVQHFMEQHPRSRVEYTQFAHYDGQQAVRVTFADVVSSAKCMLFVHPDTLQVIGSRTE